MVRALLECVNGAVLVLNEDRRIVAAAGLDHLGLDEQRAAELLGERPGDALHCLHARECPGGCGSSAACADCGALRAILLCQSSGHAVEQEYLATVAGPEGDRALELSVRATPLVAAGTRWTAVALRDISAEKRREALERVFLHDLLNTFSGLAGWAQRLERAAEHDWRRISERVSRLVHQMDGELREQRALLDAEDGTLQLHPVSLQLVPLFEELAAALSSSSVAQHRPIEIGPPSATTGPNGLELRSDRTLLRRILLNMLKNALEATPPMGTVRIWAERDGQAVCLRVWNRGAMPASVARHVFQRSFSTKPGRGRGLGTYGMRLLGERYLGGSVSFTSTSADGTTFTLRLPAP